MFVTPCRVEGGVTVIWYPLIFGTPVPDHRATLRFRHGSVALVLTSKSFACYVAQLSCLWSTNVDKSSSIWLPRSRYCRTIQKNTCAAIVGRLGYSSWLGCFGPPIEVICQLCSSVVYGTLMWTSLHRSGYPDPGIVGPYTKKEYLCSYCRTARSLVTGTARSHRFRHGSVALVLPSVIEVIFQLCIAQLCVVSMEH